MNDNEALRDIMDKLAQLLALSERTATRVEKVEGSLDKVEGSVERLDMTIRGYNNNPGLVTRIALVENSLDQKIVELECELNELKNRFEKTVEQSETRRDRSFWYMVTTLGGMVVTIATLLIGWFLR